MQWIEVADAVLFVLSVLDCALVIPGKFFLS